MLISFNFKAPYRYFSADAVLHVKPSRQFVSFGRIMPCCVGDFSGRRYDSAIIWPCVCHKSVFYRNRLGLRKNRAGFGHKGFLSPILYIPCGYQEIWVSPNSGPNFATAGRSSQSIVNLARQKADAQSPSNCSVQFCSVQFCSAAVLDPRVGHTMDVLSPFISILCHSD